MDALQGGGHAGRQALRPAAHRQAHRGAGDRSDALCQREVEGGLVFRRRARPDAAAQCAAHAGSLARAGFNQRPPTVEECEDRSASLTLRLSTVGFNTAPTPGIARTFSNSWLIAAIAG